MPGKLGKGKIERIGFESVESMGFGKGLQVKRMGEKRFWERWSTEKYGKWKAAAGKSIGGEAGQSGPDILKFIKQFDPDNSSGAVKDGLDIMQKLQDGSTIPKDLFSSIQPLKNILGGGLYGKMKAAGAAAKASGKVKQPKQQTPQDPIPTPAPDIIAELIAAAMAMCTPDEQVLIAELLDSNEISLITNAYYGSGIYVSAQAAMPIAFVNAINYLIPIFRVKEGATVS
jgi:hypothetical protein